MLMDLEHELRAMDQVRFTTDGKQFDSIEGQAWVNRVFQERLNELEVERFDTGVLRKEETTNEPALSTFVPPNLEARLALVPALPQVPQNSSEPGRRTDVLDRLGEAPVRRTLYLRRRLGPVNSTVDSGHDLRHLETGNDEYEQRGTTSRQQFSDVVKTHTFPLACL